VARSDDLRLRALKDALGGLGYPGFLSLFSEIEAEEGHDPAVVLMAALVCDRLDESLLEALPWLVLRYENLDWNWLVAEARRRAVQNRLGFVVSLALRAAAGSLGMERLTRLAAIEEELFACRLPRQESRWLRVPPARRELLSARRSEEAAQWGVLSALRPDELRFLGEI
jgi:hypothetical protein